MRHDPASAAVVVMLRGLKMYGMAQAAGDLIEPGEAYFLHSYAFVAEEGRSIAAMTDHGGGITAAVARDTIVGVQFHPEKSQAYGLALLERFLAWKP